MPYKWRLYKAAVNNNPANPRQNLAMRVVEDELEHMQYTRCDICDGLGHTRAGIGGPKMRHVTKCPVPMILKSRVGHGQPVMSAINNLRERVSNRQGPLDAEGVNGGGVHNGRVQGRYNAEAQLLAILNRYEVFRAQQNPGQGNQLILDQAAVAAFWQTC